MRRVVLVLACLALGGAAAASEVGCPARVVTPSAVATWYDPVGEGACSLPAVPGAVSVAIASADYAGSEMCGRCLHVTGPEGTVDVRVVDECPTCDPGQLDFRGAAAFDLVANPIDGIVPISWVTIGCDVGEGTMAMQFEGSNAYYLKVQVQNHRHGVAGVEILDAAPWTALTRTLDDHFVLEPAGAALGPFRFRITDVHGQSVETGDVDLVNDVPQDTGVQLPSCPEPAGLFAGAVGCATVASRRRRAQRPWSTASSSAP